jgi:hypothetical protein
LGSQVNQLEHLFFLCQFRNHERFFAKIHASNSGWQDAFGGGLPFYYVLLLPINLNIPKLMLTC